MKQVDNLASPVTAPYQWHVGVCHFDKVKKAPSRKQKIFNP
jgi:hypothetical protein